MVLETKIEAKIVAGVDKGSFNKVAKDAKDFEKQNKINLEIKISEQKLAKAQVKLKNLRKQLRDVNLTAQQKIQLQIETNRAQRNVTKLKRELNNLDATGSKSTSRLSRMFDGVGKSIASSLINPVTIAITALYSLGRAIGSASKTALSFETAFVGVQKTFDDTAEGYKKLDQGLVKLSRRMPLTYEELAGIAEVSGQLGVTGREDLLKFTEVAAGLGIATNLSAEEAATSLKRFADVLEVPISEIENLGSSLVGLGNNFAANEQEILAFAKQAQTAGLVSNLTATEILGLSTALVASGINAESGGTSIVKAFAQINNAALKGGKELEKFATVAGMTTEEFKKMAADDTSGAFISVLEGIGSAGNKSGLILDELGIKNERLRKSILAGSGNRETLREAVIEANKSYDENTALQAEVDKRLESTQGRLDITNNKWRSLSSGVGKSFNSIRVPVFEGITNFVLGMVQYFKLAKIVIVNAFDNMGIALYNFGVNITNIFTDSKAKIFDFINSAISAYNLAVGAFGGKQIDLISFDKSEKKSKKAFKSMEDDIKDLYLQYNDFNEGAVAGAEEKAKGEIKAEQDLLKELLSIDGKKPTGGKTLTKEIKDTKEYKDAVKAVGKAYDDLTGSIEKSQDAQQKLKDDIAGIEGDIADRVVTIDVEIADLKQKKSDEADYTTKQEIQADIDALNAERLQAFEGIRNEIEADPISMFKKLDDTEQAEILAQVGDIRKKTGDDPIDIIGDLLTDKKTQELQDQIDKAAEYEKMTEIEKLQALKTEKENALAAELDNETKLKEELKALEDKYMEYLQSNVTKELGWAAQLEAARKRVAEEKAKAGGGGSGGVGARAAGGPITAGSPYIVGERGPELIVPQNNGQVIPNHNLTINQNVNANVANGVDMDQLANQLARKITLAGKGIR